MESSPSLDHTRDLPAHDVFATPENQTFHSTKPYSELDAESQEIRLIKLLPDDGSGLIKCTLQPGKALHHLKGQYTALSYCAGDPKKTETILVNGIECNVFSNLAHALGEIRHFWEESYTETDKEALLWIDQICINQFDLAERSHQVGFMRDIYENTEQVLVCLSTGATPNPDGMKWLLTLPRFNLESDILHAAETFKRHIWEKIDDQGFTNGWLGFCDMLASPWWTRSWIVQEYAVAPVAHILYCRQFSPSTQINHALFPLWWAWDGLRDLDDFAQWATLNGGQDSDHNRLRFHHLQRVIGRVKRDQLENAMTSVRFLASRGNNFPEHRFGRDLSHLLRSAQFCAASDPRDKVYAFIGLADPGYRIIPNYTHSTAQVMVETTIKIINVEDDLSVLQYAKDFQRPDDSTSPFSSWAVDWSANASPESCFHFDPGEEGWEYVVIYKQASPDASFRKIPRLHSLPYYTILVVWGYYIDTLVAEAVQSSDAPRAFRKFSTYMCGTVYCEGFVHPRDQIWMVEGSSRPLLLRKAVDGFLMISVEMYAKLEERENDLLFRLKRGDETVFDHIRGRRQRISLI